MVSVCIISHNEFYINLVVEALLKGVESDRFEILIYDDCSDEPLQFNPILYPNVRVILGSPQRGIGYGFDRMIEEAKYETLVLTAGDVIVKDSSWIDKVNDYVSMYPKSIGCSVCLSGDPDHLNPDNPANDTKRYGASILPFATTDELPSDSPMLSNEFYVGLFEGKWHKNPPKENISEVPSVFGAFYFTSKSWVKHIHGWDTVRGMKLSGLSMWGGVDVFISLKSWLYGGSCYVAKDIESLHIWHKSTDNPLNGRSDHMWYSKIFIAYTCMELEEAERLVEKIYSLRVKHELYTRPFNLGKKLLKSNWDYVMQVRERNKHEMIHGFEWYLDKFEVLRKW